MKITLPDNSSRELPEGSSGYDLAKDIGPGLAKSAVAVTLTCFDTVASFSIVNVRFSGALNDTVKGTSPTAVNPFKPVAVTLTV